MYKHPLSVEAISSGILITVVGGLIVVFFANRMKENGETGLDSTEEIKSEKTKEKQEKYIYKLTSAQERESWYNKRNRWPNKSLNPYVREQLRRTNPLVDSYNYEKLWGTNNNYTQAVKKDSLHANENSTLKFYWKPSKAVGDTLEKVIATKPPWKPPNATGYAYLAGEKIELKYIDLYESSTKGTGGESRYYTRKFPSSETSSVYWELNIKYPRQESKKNFIVQAVWRTFDGSLDGTQRRKVSLSKGWSDSSHSSGWGYKEKGKWKKGTYYIEFHLNGYLLAVEKFQIY